MSPIYKSLVAILFLGTLLTLLMVANLPDPDNEDGNSAAVASEQITSHLSDQVNSLAGGLAKLSNSSYWQNAPSTDWDQRINAHSEIYRSAGLDILTIHSKSSSSIQIKGVNSPLPRVGLESYLTKVYKTERPISLMIELTGQPAILILQPIKTIENKVIGSLVGIKHINKQLLKEFHYRSRLPVVLLKNQQVSNYSTGQIPELKSFNYSPITWPQEIPSTNWQIALLVKKGDSISSSLVLIIVSLLFTLITLVYVWLQVNKVRGALKKLNETLDLDLPIAQQIKQLSKLQNSKIDPELRECSQSIRARLEQLSQQKKSLSLEIRKLQESENKLQIDKTNISQELDLVVSAPRLKSEFLSRMGDEVTTPMKSVVSMLKLLSEYPFDPEPKQLLNIAKRSTRLLVNNLNNIMDFSKLDAHMLKLKPRSLSVRELVDDMSSELAHFATEKDLSLQASSSSEMPTSIVADDYRIKQIIRNLLSNAIRFTKQGEVTLFADITAKGGHKLLRFTIADTGIGISPAAQKGLFDSLDQTTKLTNSSFAGRLRPIVSKKLAELM
ncbi:MAG: ATP-binding protein, partial [Kangiellaceae bacterium]|nr:ATP-binding protein [Kangiellaceae bacterium]